MTLVVLAVLAALVLLAAHGRPALTLGVLVGTILLMPATMVLPGSPTAVLTGSRLVELAAVVGAIRARDRAQPLRPPHVLLPLLAYAAVACVTGVGLASSQVDPVNATYTWVGTGEQVLVVLVALHLTRCLTSAQVLLVLAGLAVVTSLVGVAEWVTGESWARHVLRAAEPGVRGVPAQPLEHRSGDVRARGATEFALAYGWLMAALVPVALAATAVRHRVGGVLRAALVLGVPLTLAAVFLSRGRSPLLAAIVLLGAALGVLVPRRPAPLLALGALVAGGVVWLGPDVLARLSPDVDQGSVDVRIHRLPHVLEIAAAHPFRGTGLTGIQVLGTGLVDSSYLQVYVEAGVVAALLLVVALLAPLLATLRGVLVGRPGDDWLLALGAVGGMAALAVGAAFFDAFTTLSSARLFWLLAGAGLVAADRCAGPVRRPAWRDLVHPGRIALVVLAVGLGFAVRAVWPSHATVTALYATTDVRTAFEAQPPGLSRTLDTTLCQAAREGIDPVSDWRISTCEELRVPGWVQVAVTADGPSQASAALGDLTGRLRTYPGLAGLTELPTAAGVVSGVPTIARTAPLSLGLLAGAALLLLPARRRPALV